MNMNGYEHSMKMDETAKNGRTLKDLNLTDDFLFDITTENLENCKYIIELSLGIELKALRWKENQKVIHYFALRSFLHCACTAATSSPC